MRGTMWLMALGCGILLSSSGCCGFLRNGGCGADAAAKAAARVMATAARLADRFVAPCRERDLRR